MISFPLFLISSLAVIMTPGPDLILVLTRGISRGKQAGISSACGVASGLLVHTLAVSLGLAALLQAYPPVQIVITKAGGIYLLYLGIRSILPGKDPTRSGREEPEGGNSYFQGFLSNVLNPKIVLFFLAFLPQFVIMERAGSHWNLMALGLIFAFITWILYGTLGMASARIGSWLEGRGNRSRIIFYSSGAILLLLGARLLIL